MIRKVRMMVIFLKKKKMKPLKQYYQNSIWMSWKRSMMYNTIILSSQSADGKTNAGRV